MGQRPFDYVCDVHFGEVATRIGFGCCVFRFNRSRDCRLYRTVVRALAGSRLSARALSASDPQRLRGSDPHYPLADSTPRLEPPCARSPVTVSAETTCLANGPA